MQKRERASGPHREREREESGNIWRDGEREEMRDLVLAVVLLLGAAECAFAGFGSDWRYINNGRLMYESKFIKGVNFAETFETQERYAPQTKREKKGKREKRK